MTDKKDRQPEQPPKRAPYQRPQLKRWGTLRELTQGGGGSKKEPVTNRRTRF